VLGLIGPLAAQEPQPSTPEPAAGAADPARDLTPLPGTGESAALAVARAPAGGAAPSTWDFVRMVLVLAAVLAAIYLVFLLVKRSTSGRVRENDLITLVGSRTLGGGRHLHLVRVGTSYYLVGAADESVNLIAEITDGESLDTLKLELSTATVAGRRSFADVLGEAFGGIGAGGSRGHGHGVLLSGGEAAAGSVLGQRRRGVQNVHRRPGRGGADAGS
jgi:flagellar protein FliO/FliZ